MRFHVLALPHTVTRKDYSACAFTQKVLKFCKMMHNRGHTIFHYGHDKSDVLCTELIGITNDEILQKSYGNYDWRAQQFKHSNNDFAHTTFNFRAAEEVAKRKKPGDFLLLFWGQGHAHVAACHPDMIVVEPGIGCFNKPLAPYCVYESYAVMHTVYGKHNIMPKFFDAVVPNYFDYQDFIEEPTRETEQLKKIRQLPNGFVLVIARLIESKGIQIALEACKMLGLRLIIVGQGNLKDCINVEEHASFLTEDLDATCGLTHLGYVEPEERSLLLSKAHVLMCPTLYAEPFGGVNVEAQFAGVPVISTDWGAFAETVIHGTTGYRCRTMDHFVWALNNVKYLDRAKIKDIANANYGFAKVASMYEEYFHMLTSIYFDKGFYSTNEHRLCLKWLEKKIGTL